MSGRGGLRVQVLGGFHLFWGDVALPPLVARQARSLFAYLILNPKSRHAREKLVGTFWPDLHGSNTADRYQVVVHVDHDALAQSTGFVGGLKPDCYIESEVAIPVQTARRLSCCSKIVAAVRDGGEVLNIGRSSRAVPSAIQRALQIRDGVCQFPGCPCDHHLDAHHIIHWANGGETSLDNLIQVCHFHHKQMHEGGCSVRRDDGLLIFTNPDGTEIKQVLHATTSEGSVRPSHGYPWQWNGDSMDYSVAMIGLANADGREVVF